MQDFSEDIFIIEILKLHPMKILKAPSPLSAASRTYRKKSDSKNEILAL